MEAFLAAVIAMGALVFLTAFFIALCRESRKGPRRSISVLEPWSENEVEATQATLPRAVQPDLGVGTQAHRRQHHARVA